jgi:hypothetical protein
MAKPSQSQSNARSGCLGLIVIVVAIAIIATVTSGGGKSETPRQVARAYIKTMHMDWNTVQVSVQSVQVGITLVSKGASQGAVDQFAQLAQQAHDSIDNVRNDFATADTTGDLGNAEVEVFTAANDLKNAMGAVVTYTGNPNPETLAKFTSQYQNAVVEWDQGIRAIWRIAGERRAPTV